MIKEKIGKLIQKSDRALLTAKNNFKQEDYEASVSRAYYSMFYVVSALLISKNIKFSSHKSLILLFSEHFIKTEIFHKNFSKSLKEAFEERLKGDYRFELSTSMFVAESIIEKAESFINQIKEYLTKEGFL